MTGDLPNSGHPPPSYPYTLTAAEMTQCEAVAESMMRESHKRVGKGTQVEGSYGSEQRGNELERKTRGLVAEVAVNRFFGGKWLPQVQTAEYKDMPDAGGLCETRWSQEKYGLFLHEDEMQGNSTARKRKQFPPNTPFALVTGQRPALVIRGWFRLDEGLDPMYWRTDIHTSAFCVPIDHLWDMAMHPDIRWVTNWQPFTRVPGVTGGGQSTEPTVTKEEAATLWKQTGEMLKGGRR